jgi:nitroreductase
MSLAQQEFPLDMPLAEALMTQRAVRRLRSEPVDDQLILRLIELATKAPSGSNEQSWEFIVVRDRRVKARLARIYRQGLAVYAPVWRWQKRNDPAMLRALAAVEWQRDHFEEIPVIVVACLRGPRLVVPAICATSYYGSIYPAVQNLLLGARAAGLGAALVTLPLWNTIGVRRALGLPRRVTPCAMVPLGWPLGRYGPTRRRPVGEVVHLDRYGNRPFAG